MPDSEFQHLVDRDHFLEAMEIGDAEERAGYLERVCGEDRLMRARIEKLLELDHGASAFMSENDHVSEIGRRTDMESGEKAGDKVGNYRLVEILGEGSFGSVWLAQQERPVRRKVALKVLKLGMDTREVLARFEQESQALARMNHPNIARVLDAGATETGRPFFAMELIEGGRDITEFCDDYSLGVRERIALFQTVCETVQHAHRKGIIHRDLKPSNVLVSGDDLREVKVIDFGIAKATEEKSLTDLTIKTLRNTPMGTPAYMSPEQFVADGNIDTRTDVYSLGVLLYQLLTGVTPFARPDGESETYDELKNAVCLRIPPKPSTRLRAGTHHGETIASELSGDLDCIALKALETEPDRRYESPAALAADLTRYLNHEPIQARAHSKLYTTKLFVRRYKAAVIAATGVVLALLIGLTVASISLVREKAARELADKENLRSRKVVEILNNTLLSAGVSKSLGRDSTMLKDILGDTDEAIAADGNIPPDIEAEIRTTLARTFDDLEEYEKASANLTRAVEIYRELVESDGEAGKMRLAQTIYDQAENEQLRGDMRTSETMAREALAIFESCDWEDEHAAHVKSAEVESLIAWTMFKTGRGKEAEEMAREGYEFWLENSENKDLFNIPKTYGTLLLKLGKNDESEKVFRSELEKFREIYGPEHPVVSNTLSNFSTTLIANGKLDEAEANLHESLRQQKKFFGERTPHGYHSLGHLATIASRRGDPDGELEYRIKAAESARKTFPEGHYEREGPARGLVETLFRQAERFANDGDNERAVDRLSRLEKLAEENSGFVVSQQRLEELRAKIADQNRNHPAPDVASPQSTAH